jgi:HEAT repeat protein
VSQGLETTFGVLCSTENEAAGRVLIPALDSRLPSIRDRALEALLSRRSLAGHREILARLHTFEDPWRRKVEESHERMVPALREAVIAADRQTCVNGCRATVWLHQYDLIPALVTGLEDAGNPNAAVLSETLGDLSELLCEELAAPRQRTQWGDAHFARRRAVGTLGTSVGRFGRHHRREIVEAFLLLTYRDDAVLRQVLQDPYHSAFVVLVEMLSKIQHDAVIGLLLSFLDDPRAPSAVLSIVSKRSDLKFLRRFLHKVGREPTAAVARNLKRIETIAWARESSLLDACEDLEQSAAVRLAMTSGVPRGQAFPLVEYLLQHGKPGGRRAAAEALDQFRGADANLLALQALDDKDPEVQAKILVQLRGRGIPGALSRLVEMIDSPHKVVRNAARKCLAEFSFARYLASFDLLDEEVRSSTGDLVKKVDPQTIGLLRAELGSPVRSRRLRGLAAARALDLVANVEDAVLSQLKDEDHLVRAEAVAALGKSSSQAARDALSEALDDRSPAVQDAVRKSLRLHRPTASFPTASAAPQDKQG